MHSDKLNEARELANTVPHSITAADVSPMLVVQYVPSLGVLGTSAAGVKVATESFTFTVDGAAPTGVDTIGIGGLVTASSTYASLGPFVDYINGLQAWRCYLVGGLRADVLTHIVDLTSIACSGDNGAAVYSDTDVSDEVSVAISGEKFVSNGKNGHVKDADDFCENICLYAFALIGDGSVGSATKAIKFYSESQSIAGVQVGGDFPITTPTTGAELGENSLDEPFVKSKVGERLVVRAVSSSGALDANSIDFHVIGKTAVWKNQRVITEDNY